MTTLAERYYLKRYQTFRNMVNQNQVALLATMGVLLAIMAWRDWSFSLIFVIVFVFLIGCLGASLSLLREFRSASSVTIDPYKISQVGTDNHTATGGVLALVLFLILSTGFIGGQSDANTTDDENTLSSTSAFIQLPGVPNFSCVVSKLQTDGCTLSPRLMFTAGVLGYRDLSILLLWSLLAGYSEGAVFGLLKRFLGKEGTT
ncbi:MAG: hypothetical protein JJU05_07490 [Verrucomicrobia bacterium]|nr:hypothetical protein [Verrucomicrobiota bacterium]MCH8527769.1 hypothetical protein [Kiritimatiellia bacterium]